MNSMTESLIGAAWLQLCGHLLSVRRTGSWKAHASSFDLYVQQRWSLSKTRAKLMCDFAKFCSLARENLLRIPDSPDNIKPVLELPHRRWMDAWRVCVNYAEGPINAAHCQATLSQFGFIVRKRLPEHVLNGQRLRKAAKSLANLGDGEKVAEQLGPRGFGKDWDKAVEVVIDADQTKMTRERT